MRSSFSFDRCLPDDQSPKRSVGNGWGTFCQRAANPAMDEVCVPEIDPAAFGNALSLVAGLLAMIERRRHGLAPAPPDRGTPSNGTGADATTGGAR